MKKLKVDFHTHTSDDPQDWIGYGAFELIDRASSLGFDAMAITNHAIVTYNSELGEYAEKRNILLIPGIETKLSRKHVLIINPPLDENFDGGSLSDLAKIRSNKNLIIAPHPFYPGFKALQRDLPAHLDLFDAIEFSCFYNHFANPNKKAVKLAAEKKIPMVGNSDCHNIWQLGPTYTLVKAERDILSIIRAVKEGKVEVKTTPLSLLAMWRIAVNFFLADRLKVPWRV